MKPDTFTLQLQTVLTAYYEDIKLVVSASGYTKSKVVKRKFEDRTCARRRRHPDAGVTQQKPPQQTTTTTPTQQIPPPSRTRAQQPHQVGRSFHRPLAQGAGRGGGK